MKLFSDPKFKWTGILQFSCEKNRNPPQTKKIQKTYEIGKLCFAVRASSRLRRWSVGNVPWRCPVNKACWCAAGGRRECVDWTARLHLRLWYAACRRCFEPLPPIGARAESNSSDRVWPVSRQSGDIGSANCWIDIYSRAAIIFFKKYKNRKN